METVARSSKSLASTNSPQISTTICPVPLVVSGGTSKAEGFLEFFNQVFQDKRKRFPVDVSEIRTAKDPLEAVARGLLVQAIQEYDD